MTSIHEPEAGSLRRLDRPTDDTQAASLARRNDELELIIAASGLGFCVLEGETHELRANSRFKAEFGWAPDAPIDWQDLQLRVAPESRDALADAARAALINGVDFDLTIRTQWPNGTAQWVALHGRTSNDGNNNRTLI